MLEAIALERRLVLISVLLLALISLTYSLFQVKKVAPSPIFLVDRQIFTPATSLINFTGQGLATINLKTSSYENPFINYTDVTSDANDLEVLSTRFVRSVGGRNREYISFITVVNNTEEIARVDHTLRLTNGFAVGEETTLVMYVYTDLNITRLSLIGEDSGGNQTDSAFYLDEAYNQYYLYVQPLEHSLKKIRRINLTHICPPRGFTKVRTVFRILNIFDDRPSIDSENLVQGQWWLKFGNLEFPHRFQWRQLKALNMTVNIRLYLDSESTSTLNTMKYVWRIPDLSARTDVVRIRIFFDPSIEATITQAKILVEEDGIADTMDIMQNVTEVLSSESEDPKVEVYLPSQGRNFQVTVKYLYWTPFWSYTALFCVAVIIATVSVFLIYRRYAGN